MTRDSEVFGIREAAAFLGAHEQTVHRLARRGAIPCFKVGRDWRFRKEALLRWSEEQQQRSGGKRYVLIVDDEQDVCRVLGKMLERFGFSAGQATSGARGLEMVAEREPDLILLDLNMPNMNGPQFLAELRKSHAALPVVIVTSYPDSELMQEASRYAPLMVLGKPIDPKLLERTLRVALGMKAEAGGTRVPRNTEAG